MVQPRDFRPDDHSWESPVEGETHMEWATRRPFTLKGKTKGGREAKGESTCGGPGVRPAACGDRGRRTGPEVLPFPPSFDGGKRGSSRM